MPSLLSSIWSHDSIILLPTDWSAIKSLPQLLGYMPLDFIKCMLGLSIHALLRVWLNNEIMPCHPPPGRLGSGPCGRNLRDSLARSQQRSHCSPGLSGSWWRFGSEQHIHVLQADACGHGVVIGHHVGEQVFIHRHSFHLLPEQLLRGGHLDSAHLQYGPLDAHFALRLAPIFHEVEACPHIPWGRTLAGSLMAPVSHPH